eukprot:TRINITY_DN72821_c0_g1_i1.p1 TRINITY_DN72821_c0_g1~~TRINITY_DN72821_c0_g1_i1.p1  ORF type:complete len:173 (-),score=35.91 TRINITY_DN72821_c0_g1_i1:58-576(-)
MQAFCRPFRCLSFLGRGKRAAEYQQIDGANKPSPDAGDDDEEDFFTDSWGSPGEGAPAPRANETSLAKSPSTATQELTSTSTKRANSAASSSSSSGGGSGVRPTMKAASTPKKEVDFFNELGMEPEYRAPRTRTAAASSSRSVSSMLEDSGGAEVIGASSGGWGGEDLDLGM